MVSSFGGIFRFVFRKWDFVPMYIIDQNFCTTIQDGIRLLPWRYNLRAPLKKLGRVASNTATNSSICSVTPTSKYLFTKLFLACSNAQLLPGVLKKQWTLQLYPNCKIGFIVILPTICMMATEERNLKPQIIWVTFSLPIFNTIIKWLKIQNRIIECSNW